MPELAVVVDDNRVQLLECLVEPELIKLLEVDALGASHVNSLPCLLGSVLDELILLNVLEENTLLRKGGDCKQDRAFGIYIIESLIIEDANLSLGRLELHIHSITRCICVVDMRKEVRPLDNPRGLVPSSVSELHDILLRNNGSCQLPTEHSREPSRKTGDPSRSSWYGE